MTKRLNISFTVSIGSQSETNFRAKCLFEKFSLKFRQSPDFSIVLLTIAEVIAERCCGKTATTVVVVKNSSTAYHGVGTNDGDKAKSLAAHCRHYHIEV